MEFQRALPFYVQGTKLFGESLDSLHSENADADVLRRWAVIFATRVFPNSEEPLGELGLSFREMFMFGLTDFCVHVASSDGVLSDKEIAHINKLVDVGYGISQETASEDFKRVVEADWREDFPSFFKYTVASLGKASKGSIDAVQEVAFFFYQVAKFVHSIDNKNPYDETAPTYKFAKAFLSYVERVSAIDFHIPQNESVEEVCKERDRLVRREMENCAKLAKASWRANRGTALDVGGLPGFVLKEGGIGYVLKRRLFGMKRIRAEWKVVDRANSPTLLICVPALKASIDCSLASDGGRMFAMVSSSDGRLDGLVGICTRC